MDKKSVEEMEARFDELLQRPPCPVGEMVELIAGVPEGRGADMAVRLLNAFVEAADFNGAFNVVSACCRLLGTKLQGVAVRDALKKTTKDRLELSFIESVGFDARPLKESVGRLGRLLSFHEGALVLSAAWGLGKVRARDYFYRRVTVDFPTRRGHQFTYDAACETLVLAPEDHILVTQMADPGRVATMIKEKPGDFVKEMLTSFGDMPVTRLEELCAQYGFVKQANWKKFWEGARGELRRDKCVEIPTRRAEPIHLKQEAEDYGDTWFTAFKSLKDPKSILSSVRELQTTGKVQKLTDENRALLAERLAFALKAARGVDDALYARIAFCLDDLKLDPERVAKARAYLWAKGPKGEERYLAAARTLPAREVGSLVAFLTAEDREGAKAVLLGVLPQMCFALLSETLAFFRGDADCGEAVAKLLRQPTAPATLVTLILGRHDSHEEFYRERRVFDGRAAVPGEEKKPKGWECLPDFITLLTHAIALGEGKQGGETLRMQNVIRRLFADQKWLEGIFRQLQPADQALFFERFQASIAWDPSTHHMIVVRMTHIVPELAARQVKKEEAAQVARITSLRSYAERQAAYEKLVKVEIPANTKRIEFAKSYGDLSENAEYQYAKDEQRALMQKESLLQKDLNEVKAVNFADVVEPAAACPGSMVTITTGDGAERVYTILGEWDNDLARNVISNKTKLAQNMLGKKAGDTFDLPDAEGRVSTATIKAVSALTDEMRTWLAETPAAV